MDDKKYLECLGIKIRGLRKERGLTQRDLAQRLGSKAPIEIIRIEKGEVNSTINKLRAIAKELDISIAELVSID